MAKHFFIKILLPFVFLSTVSILNSQALITASITTPGNAGILSENCDGPYELVIRRGESNNLSTEIYISGDGDAILGTDYTFAGTSFPVIMQPSDSIEIIPIFIVNDGLIEGLESVQLEIAFLAGIESDFIMLETAIVDAYDVEIESSTDTIVWCRNVPYVLLASSTADEIFWSPSHVFDDSLGTAATVRPFESGWYYASVGTEECGAKDSVYFNLAIAEIENPDTVYICIDGNGVLLQGNLEGLATDFIWIPSDSTLSNPDILTPIANPVVTTTYILQSDIGVCVASDRIVVRVDSLPANMHIDIAPAKPYYCAGEVVALFSPSFDTLLYPDITFLWKPDEGTFESDITLYNAALTLQDTTLYIRDNINNACRSADSILIDVVPSAVPISVSDTMLCPGESFQVFILSNQVTEPMWTPEQGLSCTSCLNPNVTVIGAPGSTLFYEFSGKINDCPVGANLTIQIPPLQVITIAGDNIVCEGDVIQLNITNGAGLSEFDWEVSGGNVTMDCDDCPNPIVTINSINQPITLTVSANTLSNQFCGAFGTFVFSEGGTENIMIAGDSIVCDGDMSQLQITNPAGITDLNWSITTGVASLSCTNCPNPNVTFNQVDGTVVVQVTGTSSNQDFCHAFGVFEFTEGTTNQIIVDPFTACLGENVTVSIGDPNVSDLQWTILSGIVNLSCNNCNSPVVTLNSPQSQLMFIGETTNPNFCRVSGTVVVMEPDEDESNILLDPDPQQDTINQGSPVIATLFASPTPLSVTWTLNGVNVSGTVTSIQFDAVNATNTVIATFINSSGCEQMDSITFITIPPSFLIPNAFTPNGDEINNTFRIIIMGAIAIDEFLIFNRWGQLVYDAPQDDLAGWDGMFKGEPAASDTYVYSAKLRYPDGRIEVAKGDVMLLR